MNDSVLFNAYREHQRGNLAEAARLLGEILRTDPKHADALSMLGSVHLQRGEIAEAHDAADEAMRNAGSGSAAYNLGCLLQKLGRHGDALSCFEKALAANPNSFEALIHRGLSHLASNEPGAALASFDKALAIRPHEAGAWINRANALLLLNRREDAVADYDRALCANPAFAEAWINRGRALAQLERYEDALASYDRALQIRPDDIVALLNRGVACDGLRRFADALANFDKVLSLDPHHREALFRRANALNGLGRHREALSCIDRCLALAPDDGDALVARGVSLHGLGSSDEALACNDRALTINPQCIEALINQGRILGELKRYEDALRAYANALALYPECIEALVSRGGMLSELGRYDDAICDYDKALAIDPECLDALVNRGRILGELRRFEDAARNYEKALSLDPGLPYLPGIAAHYRLQCCEWGPLEQDRAKFAADVAARERVVPFINLVFSRSPAEQLSCAQSYAAREHPVPPEPLWRGEVYAHDRIRLAYVSADFRAHPTSYLLAGAVEHHDKRRFETVAISFGPDDESETRGRIMRAFQRFVDVRRESAAGIARLMREMEVDIAVDLMGFTTGSRTGIFAARAAPLQVNYLGYPGTTGSGYFDYIIADRTVIPEAHRSYYSEQIVVLPDCYLPNDSARRIGARTPARSEAGLPAAGFVFACFNNSYKFSPETFAIWMRLLEAVAGSVLWLPENNPAAIRNLRREAKARGIAAERVVFAPYLVSAEEHLARLRLADLFLDTLPFNAHTTACDALWATVPVITCLGTTFAGRVAASALHAIGMSELITLSLDDYETLALRLARDPGSLAALKAKLAANRQTHPLFDTQRFTRQLETAFHTMWERYRRGLEPQSFAVDGAAGASGPPS